MVIPTKEIVCDTTALRILAGCGGVWGGEKVKQDRE